MTDSLKKVFIFTGITALLVRVIYGFGFLSSELAAFNYLPGLDMATLLRFSEWTSSDPESLPMFVLHRFLLFFCYILAGKSHNVILIYAVQSLFGIAASIFAAQGVWLLSKNRKAAFAGGLLYAVYGPFMLYESVALQESVLVHTLTIAFVLLLNFRENKSLPAGILCGLLLGLNSSGRPATAFAALVLAMFPLWEMRKEKFDRRLLSIPLSLLLVWLCASLFNGYFRNSFSPFFNVLPHLVEVHAPAKSAAGAAAGNSCHPYLSVFAGAIKNVPILFGMREVPENLDYDVIRKLLPILSVGPLLLMPFAIAGMITFLLSRRKELLILYIAVASLALPLASRVPIGRYRLMLIPFFIIFAVLFVLEMIENRQRRLAMAGITVGVIGCNMLCASPLVRPNPPAHHTLALAAEIRRTDSKKHLLAAWEKSGYTYKPSGLMLVLDCMKKQNYSAAENIIAENKSNAPEFLYYLALIRTAQSRFAEASAILNSIPEPEKLGKILYPKYRKLAGFLHQKR